MDLCGGGSVMVIPTATNVAQLRGKVVIIDHRCIIGQIVQPVFF